MHDARDVVLAQAPGTHAGITADGVHLVLRRDGARVVEVLDLQGAPALQARRARRLGAQGRADRDACSSVTTGAPDPRDPAWLSIGGGDALRFHYPGTHGEVAHRWSVPLRVDGRAAADPGRGRARGAAAARLGDRRRLALAAGAGLVLRSAAAAPRAYVLVAALAVAAVVVSYGESQATGARPWGALVAASSALAGLALAFRLRRDAALEQGVAGRRPRSCSCCRWSAASPCCATA